MQDNNYQQQTSNGMKNIYFKKYPCIIAAVVLGVLILMLSIPLMAHAQNLIPCGGENQPVCTFSHFIQLIQRVINFLLVSIAIPLSMILFAYAGWLYMSAAGDSGKIEQGHKIFKNVVLGLVFALAAWLIVNTVAVTLLSDKFPRNFLFLGS